MAKQDFEILGGLRIGSVLAFDSLAQIQISNVGLETVAGTGSIADMVDVNISNITDGQIIKWDSASQNFAPANDSDTFLLGLTNSSNTGLGDGVLASISSGVDNVVVGESGAASLSTGSGNTIIGDEAGSSLTSESSNTIIGRASGSTIVGKDNQLIVADGQGNISIAGDSSQNVTMSAAMEVTGALTFGSLTNTTDDVTEGSTNLYYTTVRFDSDFGTMSTTDLAEGDKLFYTTARFDSDFGDNSTTDLAEGDKLFYTTVRFDSDFGTMSTTDLAEGDKLFYTTVRFDSDFGDKSTTDLAEGDKLFYQTVRFDSDFGTKTSDDLSEGLTNKYYKTSYFNSDFALKTTTDLAEGDKLYYTTVRFDSDFGTMSTTDLAEGDKLFYQTVRFDSDFGTMSTTDLAEGDKLFYQTVRFDSDFGTMSTTDLAEGDKLYYTASRADSDAKNAISAGTGVTYTPATGVIAIGQAVATTDDVQFSSVKIDDVALIDTSATPAAGSAGATQVISSFAIADWRSARFTIQVSSGNKYQTSEILVLHDGSSTAMTTEFGVIKSNGVLATFSAAISGSVVELSAVAESAEQPSYKVVRHQVSV